MRIHGNIKRHLGLRRHEKLGKKSKPIAYESGIARGFRIEAIGTASGTDRPSNAIRTRRVFEADAALV